MLHLKQNKLERHISEKKPVLHTFTIDLFNNAETANLNIGGQIFRIKWSLINKIPKSRIGKILNAANLEELSSLCDEINIQKKELYFDRSPNFFSQLCGFYYSEAVHIDNNICVLSLYDELIYWGLEDQDFDLCCSFKFNEMKLNGWNQIEKIFEIENTFKEKSVGPEFTGSFKILKEKTWNIMENPETSLLAKVF